MLACCSLLLSGFLGIFSYRLVVETQETKCDPRKGEEFSFPMSKEVKKLKQKKSIIICDFSTDVVKKYSSLSISLFLS